MTSPLQPGDTVGRYTIDVLLGEGGMGRVYRAHDDRLDRRVALKIVQAPPDAEGRIKARVIREARAVAALDHPNVVSIYDVGEVGGTPFIAMELVQGSTLRERVGDPSAAIGDRIGWLVDVARALAAAHKAGIVHRDVKPENVMVRSDGRVKVLDFGIARRERAPVDATAPTQSPAASTLTASGEKLGTPMYMAPEQIRGEAADGRTDQFAWGVLAYEILEGASPWGHDDALGLVAAVMTEEPRPMRAPDVPAKARAIVQRALSKSPAERFGSMDDIVTVLSSLAGMAPPAAADAPVAPAAPAAGPGAGGSGGAIRKTARQYSTDELREILQRALERQEQTNRKRYTHGDLVEAAREVGIDEEALREASREVAPLPPVAPARGGSLPEAPRSASMALDADRLRQRQRLMRHVGIWFAFSVFFFMIDMLTSGGVWFYFPVLAWGVGVAVQAVAYLFPVEPTAEERARRLEKLRRRARKRGGDAFDRDVNEGVALILNAAEQRARIAPSARLRVEDARGDADAEATEAAEQEAAAEAARPRRRRK